MSASPAISELVFADQEIAPRANRRVWEALTGLSRSKTVGLTEYASLEECEATVMQEQSASGEAWLVRPIQGVPLREIPTRAITEVRIQTVFNSSHLHFVRSVEESIVPVLQEAGAGVSSQYEIVIGPARPTVVTFIGWDSLAHLHVGHQLVDGSGGMQAKRDSELTRYGRTLEESVEMLVLRDAGEQA